MDSVSEQRVTDFDAAGPVKGTDVIYADQGSGAVAVTADQLATYARQPLAAVASPDAGPLNGDEVVPVSRGTQLLQTTISRIAAFVLGKPLAQATTTKFWARDGAAINRQNDRVLVGAATVNSGDPNGVGSQDWDGTVEGVQHQHLAAHLDLDHRTDRRRRRQPNLRQPCSRLDGLHRL